MLLKFTDLTRLKGFLNVSARPGSTVKMEGEVSDPDGDAVSVKWWQYNDGGCHRGDITFSSPTGLKTTFRVPDDAKPGQTINIVLEATDNGTPPLTRYQRIIVAVQ